MRIACSIPREDAASAEATGKRELHVRGEAESYGVTRIHAGVKDAARWADRLQRWRKGEVLESAAAHVVKR